MICFILIQNKEILDVSHIPDDLKWGLVDNNKDFQVHLGTVENNKHGVDHLCAFYRYKPEGAWYLTSPMDGYKRLVGRAEPATDLIRNRLQALYVADKLHITYEDAPEVSLECV